MLPVHSRKLVPGFRDCFVTPLDPRRKRRDLCRRMDNTRA
jgi:hypothetical protein